MDSGNVVISGHVCGESMFSVQLNPNDKQWPFKCAVPSCRSIDDRSVIFHSFPDNFKLAEIWRKKCGIPATLDLSTANICSSHFADEDYADEQQFSRQLNPHSIPHINLPALDNSLLPEHPIVHENKELEKRYDDLLDFSSEVEHKCEVYDRKIKCLQRLSVITSSKLKRLRHMESTIKKEKDLMSAVFSSAQTDLLLGRKKVKWNDDDLARAFTLRHMGGKDCYLYLKNTLNIPLPSLSCVQRWAASDV